MLKTSLMGSTVWVYAICLSVFSVSWFVISMGGDSNAAATVSTSPVLDEIREHLNEVSSNIASYMQSRDPFAIERVKAEGKQIGHLVSGLSKELTEQGQRDSLQQLERAHNGLREASVTLLAADQDVVTVRKTLEEVADSLRVSLVHRDASSKTKLAESRALLDRHTRLSTSLDQAHNNKQLAMDRFLFWRESFDKALREIRLPQSSSRSKALALAIQGFFLIGVPFLLYFVYWYTRKQIAHGLKSILHCVEAASTGDTSRLPDHWAANEVGRLSQAVGRLISVLARSENLVYHLAALVESSGDAIISHTLEGKILSWNKGAQRIYGFSAEEMKGRMIEALMDDEGKKEMMQMLKRLQAGERVKPFEMVHGARNGRQVRALVRLAAIYDSTRQMIGASFIAQELTPAQAARQPSTESKAN